MKKNIATTVADFLRETIDNLGYELYDVDYSKKQNGMNLTLFIVNKSDKLITIDDCEKVHRIVDPLLDELNPTGDTPYYLNVSSLGLDRPIKTEKDFLYNKGKLVDVKLFQPIDEKKDFTAQIVDFKDNKVLFSCGEKNFSVDIKSIANCKLHIDFWYVLQTKILKN